MALFWTHSSSSRFFLCWVPKLQAPLQMGLSWAKEQNPPVLCSQAFDASQDMFGFLLAAQVAGSCPGSHPPSPPSPSWQGFSPSVRLQLGLIPGAALIQHLVLLNLFRFPWATSGACPDLSGVFSSFMFVNCTTCGVWNVHLWKSHLSWEGIMPFWQAEPQEKNTRS